jgi:FSR family fosmidomycin resistance protein-like MFS transporter
MTFLPLHLHARGFTLGRSGAIVSLYLLSGALGGFLGGWLSDRIGGRRVIVASFAGSAPLFFAFLFLPDAAAIPCLVLGAFVLQASLPVNVVLGQELAPEQSSTVSSLLMGAAWGVGALLIGPIGALADRTGILPGLTVLSGMLVVGLACAVMLPPAREHAGVVEAL